MATRKGQQQTRVARQAAKLAARQRRAERRQIEKATAHARKADSTAKPTVKSRRPVGRPPKPASRPARWSRWRPEFARKVYRAIARWEINPHVDEIADLLSVTPRTVRNWLKAHPPLTAAVERAYSDRAAVRGALLSCRRH